MNLKAHLWLLHSLLKPHLWWPTGYRIKLKFLSCLSFKPAMICSCPWSLSILCAVPSNYVESLSTPQPTLKMPCLTDFVLILCYFSLNFCPQSLSQFSRVSFYLLSMACFKWHWLHSFPDYFTFSKIWLEGNTSVLWNPRIVYFSILWYFT